MNDIGDLYDRMHPLLFTNRSRAIHYGFWERGVRSFSSAQARENLEIAELANVQEGERILDAGSGAGGSALWLAEHRGAHVIGVSLGKREVASANKTAKRISRGSVRFMIADLVNTDLPDSSFDLIWAIESVLYVPDKRAVVSEFSRVLAPTGRVAVADLFLARAPVTDEERDIHASFSHFSRTAQLPTYVEMMEQLRHGGFREATFIDKRSSVLITSFLYLANAILTVPIVLPFYLLWPRGLIKIVFDHARMAFSQWRGLRSGLFTYGIVLARK